MNATFESICNSAGNVINILLTMEMAELKWVNSSICKFMNRKVGRRYCPGIMVLMQKVVLVVRVKNQGGSLQKFIFDQKIKDKLLECSKKFFLYLWRSLI